MRELAGIAQRTFTLVFPIRTNLCLRLRCWAGSPFRVPRGLFLDLLGRALPVVEGAFLLGLCAGALHVPVADELLGAALPGALARA